jgi:hypothetical protein
VHLRFPLAVRQGRVEQRVDFLDAGVAHGIAADGHAAAVHHQEVAGAAVRTVVGVGIAQVEREVVLAARIELAAADPVEAFGRLAVALAQLGPERARPGADGIGAEQAVAAPVVQPQLEFALGLEDADEDRRAQRQRGRRQVALQRRPHARRGRGGAVA